MIDMKMTTISPVSDLYHLSVLKNHFSPIYVRHFGSRFSINLLFL